MYAHVPCPTFVVAVWPLCGFCEGGRVSLEPIAHKSWPSRSDIETILLSASDGLPSPFLVLDVSSDPELVYPYPYPVRIIPLVSNDWISHPTVAFVSDMDPGWDATCS